jgi:hypothetical protein
MAGTIFTTARRRVAAMVAVLSVMAIIAVAVHNESSTADPRPSSASSHDFSAARAMDELADIAEKPRPIGSPESDQVRDWLSARLTSEGFDVEVPDQIGSFGYPGIKTFGRVENVVGTLPGTDPTGRILLVSHYDSVAAGPGAADAAAQVAAILETVRAVKAQGTLRNDLVVIFTDGEEDGLLGAQAFTDEHPGTPTDVVLNWEARGSCGPSLMFETSPGNAGLIDAYIRAAPHPRGDSSTVEAYRFMPNNTDFTRFSEAGFAGLNSAHIEGAAWYHTPGDTVSHMDKGTMQSLGANMLGMTRHLGDADLSTLDNSEDAVYFGLFGAMVSYRPALVWPLAVTALLIWLAGVALARHRRLLSLPKTLAAAGTVLAPTAAAAGLGAAMWWLMTTLRPGYLDTGGLLYRSTAFELALLTLVGVAVLAWYPLSRRWFGPAATALGALAWPVLLSGLCAAAAPGSSFLFTVPAIAGSLGLVGALLLRDRNEAGAAATRQWAAIIVVVVTTALSGIMPVGTSLSFLTTFGLEIAALAVIPLALFAVTLAPLLELFVSPKRPRRRNGPLVVATAALLSMALVATGMIVDRYDERYPQRSQLAYLLDADTGDARWFTTDAEPAEWTRQFADEPGFDSRATLDGFAGPELGTPTWSGAAEPITATAPAASVTVVSRDTLRVTLASRRDAPNLRLAVDAPVSKVTAQVSGRDTASATVSDGPSGHPTVINFSDAPATGVEFTITLTEPGTPRLTGFDESYGLDDVPGFSPRPGQLFRSPDRNSDTVMVGTTIEY